MSDDNILSASVSIDPNTQQFEALKRNILSVESAWGRLGSLPVIDLNTKFRTLGGSSASLGSSSSYQEHRAAVASLQKEETELKKLSYSWDSVYKQQLAFITDKNKKEKFLEMMEKEAFKGMRNAPASKTGKYHPEWANTTGGLVRHSQAVASGALGLAQAMGYTGNKDDLVTQALAHDMKKQTAYGFYNPKHDLEAAAAAESYGLASSAIKTHMYIGKGENVPLTDEQKILKESDWLNSRTYAGDFTKWNATGTEIESQDILSLKKEAIKRGDAKAGPKGENDFLVPTVEMENKKAKAAKEWENSWHSVLSTAGKLAAVLGSGGLVGKVFKIGMEQTAEGAAQIQGGLGAFTDISTKAILDNLLREKKAILPAGSISKEQQALAVKRGQFNLTGEGDFLPLAQLGQIGNLLQSTNPMDVVYGQIIDELIGQVKGAKTSGEKGKLLALISKTMGPAAVGLVNAGVELNQTYAGLGARTAPDEGYLNWSKEVMALNAEMVTSINGIKDTWKGLFTTFQSMFGNPFLAWMDTTFRALGVDVFGSFKSQNALGISNTMLAGKGAYDTVGQLASEFDKDKAKAEADYKASERGKNLKLISEGSFVTAKAEENLKKKWGRMYPVYKKLGTPETIKEGKEARAEAEAEQAAFLSSVGIDAKGAGGLYQKELGGAGAGKFSGKWGLFTNPTALRTAKTVSAFDTQHPGVLGSKLDALLNPNRAPGNFDEAITNALDIYDKIPSRENKASLDAIIQDYVDVENQKKIREGDKNKVSMTGPSVIINAQFSGDMNAQQISQGLQDAAGKIPSRLENAMNSMYVG